MVRLAVPLVSLAGPAAGEITRSECIDLLSSAEAGRQAASLRILSLRDDIFDAADGVDEEEAFAQVLDLLRPPQQGPVPYWTEVLDALVEVCRDRL